jgi:RHS repeat-associated protein
MLTMTLASGSWTNTFNAENRIIAQEKSDARLEYVYDYMGRRVEKKVYSGSVGNWVLDEDLKFVYDRYWQIEELDALNSNAVAKKRIWMKGKVICDIHGTTPYYAMGDANKNISEYVDSTGTVQAHYEYSPFGKIIAKTGIMQDDFDYRFSSEYADDETGLVYYNYRYYSSEWGRWTKRDSFGINNKKHQDKVELKYGSNLYAMVYNNPVRWWDILGKTPCMPGVSAPYPHPSTPAPINPSCKEKCEKCKDGKVWKVVEEGEKRSRVATSFPSPGLGGRLPLSPDPQPPSRWSSWSHYSISACVLLPLISKKKMPDRSDLGGGWYYATEVELKNIWIYKYSG